MPNTTPAAGARAAAEDLAVAAVAGYLATKAMEPVSEELYELESDTDRAREDAARPGPPYRIALPDRRREDHPLDRGAP
jgi:hypothetical protein